MEKSLCEAAKAGNVNLLLELLQQDALLLDRFIAGRYTETPLHIASMLGHLEFVQEILTRKPELAKELDSSKASPFHLATAKGYLEIVKSCKASCQHPKRSGSCQAPCCSSSNGRGDAILHACVRHNQLEAMKFLVEAISYPYFMNYQNYDGNTVLHLAVADRQLEAVNFLIATSPIEVNLTNADGLTALDILSENERDVKDKEIAESLRSAGANASMAFQAALTPPGGGGQGNFSAPASTPFQAKPPAICDPSVGTASSNFLASSCCSQADYRSGRGLESSNFSSIAACLDRVDAAAASSGAYYSTNSYDD
ncbi:hypothetical protein SLEP1_g15022 [Rubroshorea leprosula]|uniref:Uncharacterized protein n=1 Tax=Rubroshorea leprosula TaxID=152421 RepID=A0AAV5IS43_9ROSI|nr:hypothetical protein SLEP1_g15022 [Rubroshorea leprosula]